MMPSRKHIRRPGGYTAQFAAMCEVILKQGRRKGMMCGGWVSGPNWLDEVYACRAHEDQWHAAVAVKKLLDAKAMTAVRARLDPGPLYDE